MSRRLARYLQTSGTVRWVFILIVFTAVGVTAYWHHDQLVQAFSLMRRVSPWLVLAAAAAVTGAYFSRASAYRIPLNDMGYAFRRTFLARTALLATTAHHLIPTGGASGYVFITYAFHRRGVAAGQASILALVDTLSNAVALALLVIVVLMYLAFSAATIGTNFVLGLVPGVGLLAIAAGVYYLQRDRARLQRFAGSMMNRLGARTGSTGPNAGLDRFLDQYYEGKRLIISRPHRFLLMVAWQHAAIACSSLALYAMFFALGLLPSPWIVFIGLVLAMAGVSVTAAPAGGGSFEVVMSGFFVLQGIDLADSIAATLLYRLVSFWLPALASVPIVLQLRHRRNEVERLRVEPPLPP